MQVALCGISVVFCFCIESVSECFHFGFSLLSDTCLTESCDMTNQRGAIYCHVPYIVRSYMNVENSHTFCSGSHRKKVSVMLPTSNIAEK